MRATLTAAALILALSGAAAAEAKIQVETQAPLPATPRLPSFGKNLFGPRPSEQSASNRSATATGTPDRPTLLLSPATTLAGREATLQALQNCYAREATRVIGVGAAETRVRRLRQLCENEEIADTRAWLKWSKLGDVRQGRKIVDAIQEDDAQKALAVGSQTAPDKS